MKKFLTILAAALSAAAFMTVLSACNDVAKDTGNKIVSNAESYLQSEVGFDGDVSKLASDAGSYVQNELGLNNASNQVLEGTWKQDKDYIDDWQWTFDGKGNCTLKSEQYNSSASGTYQVNESEKTVSIHLDTWEEAIPFTYQLRKTLSDETLKLSSETQGYSLTKQK